MILETRHLQLISAMAEHGTLTRAARDLNVTQSALSHSLISLERRLAIPLFHRLGTRMTLTAAGQRLLVAAERTLGELRTAEADVLRTAEGKSAVLRISTECYTTYHWMPRIMSAFADRYPEVELQIVAGATADPLAALRDGVIDIAVMMRRHSGKGIRATPLFEDEMVVVAARDHRFAGRSFVELDELCEEHLLVYSTLDVATSHLGRLLRDAGIVPRRVSQIMLTEAIIEIVAAGLGVSVLARWAAAPSIASGKVAAIPLTKGGIHRTWHAVTPRRSVSAGAISAFVSMLNPGPRVLAAPPIRGNRV
jgi:LysR family transcriptional regulator for metE and metH